MATPTEKGFLEYLQNAVDSPVVEKMTNGLGALSAPINAGDQLKINNDIATKQKRVFEKTSPQLESDPVILEKQSVRDRASKEVEFDPEISVANKFKKKGASSISGIGKNILADTNAIIENVSHAELANLSASAIKTGLLIIPVKDASQILMEAPMIGNELYKNFVKENFDKALTHSNSKIKVINISKKPPN